MTELSVQSRTHLYAVRETYDLTATLDSVCQQKQTFLLIDANVWKIYGKEIGSRISQEQIHVVEASEEMKSYAALENVFCAILESGFRKNDHLIIMGGGVLQDIGCYIASVLFRGVSWTLFPSTLLAQCDSCIGSKSSLNIGRFKNQLGTFCAPTQIFLYFPFLETLSDQEIWSGLGEAVKLHLIDGASAWACFLPKILTGRPSPKAQRQIVWDCLSIKKEFVEKDEFDRGIRNILNYGHTFAHAFESATNYAIPHGIAVLLGILAATRFSRNLGWVEHSYEDSLRHALLPCTCGFLSSLGPSHVKPVLAAMQQDKKNSAEGITFILTRGAGAMEKKVLSMETVSTWLGQFLEAKVNGPA